MPFLMKTNIILDPGSAKATYKDHDTILRCSATAEITATAATITPQDTVYDEHQTIPRHLAFLNLIRHAIAASRMTLEDTGWDEDIYRRAQKLNEMARMALAGQLPDFKQELQM